MAKLVELVDRPPSLGVRPTLSEYCKAHAIYVILKHAANDPLLEQRFSSDTTFFNFLDAQNHKGLKQAKEMWRACKDEFIGTKKEGDIFSWDLVHVLTTTFGPQSVHDLWAALYRYLSAPTATAEGLRVLMAIDGIDTLNRFVDPDLYDVFLRELTACLPTGEGSSWYSCLLVALRPDTKADINGILKSNHIAQPGRGSRQFVMQPQNAVLIAKKRVEQCLRPTTAWAAGITSKLSTLDRAQLNAFGWILEELVVSMERFTHIVRRSLPVSGEVPASVVSRAVFGHNQRSLHRNLLRKR